ncbi:MAG: hypothetical protein Q8P30_02470 [Candidatus Uhrbacteria bacterium]|nr:hypothetical protein [Candidatus Uhrbacteria bacterium]
MSYAMEAIQTLPQRERTGASDLRAIGGLKDVRVTENQYIQFVFSVGIRGRIDTDAFAGTRIDIRFRNGEQWAAPRVVGAGVFHDSALCQKVIVLFMPAVELEHYRGPTMGLGKIVVRFANLLVVKSHIAYAMPASLVARRRS